MQPVDIPPVSIPIDGVLDLHTFNPKQVPDLLDGYLLACAEKGIYQVRIIHGKGKGIQKARVRSLLARHPLVVLFKDAPADIGGWGATLVELKHVTP
jgi:DNA-nicking Smr family endonuclease